MASIKQAVLIMGAGLFASLNLLHAQITPPGGGGSGGGTNDGGSSGWGYALPDYGTNLWIAHVASASGSLTGIASNTEPDVQYEIQSVTDLTQTNWGLDDLWPFKVNYALHQYLYDPTYTGPTSFTWQDDLATTPAPAILGIGDPYWISQDLGNLADVGAYTNSGSLYLQSGINNLFGLAFETTLVNQGGTNYSVIPPVYVYPVTIAPGGSVAITNVNCFFSQTADPVLLTNGYYFAAVGTPGTYLPSETPPNQPYPIPPLAGFATTNQTGLMIASVGNPIVVGAWAMISAQWAKGHGGLYRYYRCTRKTGICYEPYAQEKLVVDQCLEAVKPLAISAEEANFVRALIDKKSEKDGQALETASAEMNDKISLVQKKLNKLTCAFLDEVIDEESYQAAKAGLVLEKTTLKQQKEQLHKTRSSSWNEPVKEVINIMELAGKSQTTKSPQELAQVVHKVGTNRLLSRKTVTFSFSEPYAFIPSLLVSRPVTMPTTSPPLGDETGGSPVWCMLVTHLRTYFSNKSVFDEGKTSL
jgi:hypothetical protein